jgi:hypothetical protein
LTAAGTALAFGMAVCVAQPAVYAQNLPAAGDSRHSMLREAMLGLLRGQPRVSSASAAQHCLGLPIALPNDRIEGPHGDSLVSAHCDVVEYKVARVASATRFSIARYRWRSVFTAEDSGRGASARDTVPEEEVVLFESTRPGLVHAVWHARIETGRMAVWASVTPEIAPSPSGAMLLSVMECLNGTGGCGQEFLQRRASGQWAGVWQAWLDQLPAGFLGKIRHGVRIQLRTLRGTAGFYGDGDPNCCASSRLVVQLKLRGDSLHLAHYAVERDSLDSGRRRQGSVR